MEILTAEFSYSWQPFTLDGQHLHFAEHSVARLERTRCSWWGPAVYKWAGEVTQGPHAGQRGVLIGETANIRSRIKQYLSGTQERGNKLWRESFLNLGSIRLYILALETFSVSGTTVIEPTKVLARTNLRLVLEQLLVAKAVAEADDSVWIVNAKQ